MGWLILVFYPEPEGKNLLISSNPCINSKHIPASMNYFDSDMSKSTNAVVYFDWKTVIYIYACGQCRIKYMLPIRADDDSSTCTSTTGKSVTCTGACVNEIIANR
jgi:hypothetical protein